MDRDDERGSVTMLVLVMVPALLALAALVVDGGLMLSVRREGVNVAHGAARVASQEIDPSASRRAGEPVLDRAEATRAGHRYLAARGWNGKVVVASDHVRVTVAEDRKLVLLGAFGGSSRTITVSSTARPVHGVATGEN